MNIGLKSVGVLFLVNIILSSVCYADYSETENIEFWRKNYKELTPAMDKRVDRAQEIFKRLKYAAGVGDEERPSLYILAEDPYQLSLPIAIRDKWVIMSKHVLDICYSDPDTGADKLAFVLGHELAHLLHDSYMHVELFNAIDKLRSQGNGKELSVDKLRKLVSKPEHFAYREFEADERGITYAAMAGFDTSAVVGERGGKSFFQEWQDAQGIGRYLPDNISDTHPVIKLREQEMLKQLKTVDSRAQLFRIGMMYYEAGNFELAAKYLSEFLPNFPSREVYHNLAISYHQLAIRRYLESAPSKELDVKFNLIADPESRAIYSSVHREGKKEESFGELLKKAIKFYNKALQLDPAYQIAYVNLGAAYILAGDPYKAIALLKDTVLKWPANSDMHNVLGVAFFLIDKKNEALNQLNMAYRQDRNPAAIYNLGRVYYSMERLSMAREYWGEYLKIDNSSYWARNLRNKYQMQAPMTARRGLPELKFETVKGLQVADYVQDIPASWKLMRSYDLKQHRQKILQYDNGIETVVKGDAISMIKVNGDYRGKTKDGISIGMLASDILKQYGPPAMDLTVNADHYWVYPNKGLSFQINDQNLVSWMVY